MVFVLSATLDFSLTIILSPTRSKPDTNTPKACNHDYKIKLQITMTDLFSLLAILHNSNSDV